MTSRAVFPLALSRSGASLPYLPLGMITAFLREYEGGTLKAHYQIGEVLPAGVPGRPLKPLYERIGESESPVVLLSSYVWNHELNMQAARRIKRSNPGALVVVGGPEIPKWPGESEAFLKANRAVDMAVLGEGELACAELLSHLATGNEEGLEHIPGLVYRQGKDILRSGDRQRVKELDRLPSPYLNGEFDNWIDQVPMATLETNRGCPYGCTYCDWGSATLEKVSKFSLQRVRQEVDYLGRKQMDSIFIADANFGMLEQDVEIARALVEARARYGYPKRLYTNFAKNGGRRLMSSIGILHKGGLLPTGIVALQTTDQATLEAIKRDNIRTASYEKMMEYFNSERIPMASDLMIGLPGQTVEALHEDLQFCFDWKISANGNYTSMMPNAPMAEAAYRAEHAIETDADNMIASTSTFSAEDLEYMRKLYLSYLLMVRMALLKYFLYFLQIDHGIAAIAFLRRWLTAATDDDKRYPMSARVYRELLEPAAVGGHWAHVTWDESAQFLFAHLDAFYAEIAAFSQDHYGVALSDSEKQAIFAAQAAVMPNTEQSYPVNTALDHDVRGYFDQLRPVASLRKEGAPLQPLRSLAAGELVAGNEDTAIETIAMHTMLGHSDEGWELPSPLRFY